MSKSRTWTVVAITTLILAAIPAFNDWFEPVDKKVERLLHEVREAPIGGDVFEVSFFKKSFKDIRAEFDHLGSRAVPALVEKGLKYSDVKVRQFAVRELGRMGDRSAVEPLIQSLRDTDPLIGATAAHVLGDFCDERAVDPLIACLSSEDSGIRWAAAESLGKIGDKRAFEPLIPMLIDADIYCRAYAVWAIGKLGNPRALEILLNVLEGNDDGWIRSKAAEGLGDLGDERAIPALRKARSDPDWMVKGAATKSLARLGK